MKRPPNNNEGYGENSENSILLDISAHVIILTYSENAVASTLQREQHFPRYFDARYILTYSENTILLPRYSENTTLLDVRRALYINTKRKHYFVSTL